MTTPKLRHPLMVITAAAATALLLFSGCQLVQGATQKAQEFNAFPVADDVRLGKQVSMQIESDRTKYNIIPESQNPTAYAYIRRMRDKILATGRVKYRSVFPWEIKLIKDDNTLNAFCTPGGYIYIYTGLIKVLDTEHQLAGVLGHEMAHADKRHSTRQMTQVMGLDAVRQVALGQYSQTLIAQAATTLATLSFSRSHEAEADEYSVRYLCGTDYQADGAAGFFEKIRSQSRTPAFLSTHPDPANRIQDIKAHRTKMNCPGTQTYATEYQRFKSSL